MGLSAKHINLAAESLLSHGTFFLDKVNRLIRELFGNELLLHLGDSNIKAATGHAVFRVCELTDRSFDEEDVVHLMLLDRALIAATQTIAQTCLPEYSKVTSTSTELSTLIRRWVVRNAELPATASPNQALPQIDPWSWVDRFRLLLRQEAEGERLDAYDDSVLLFRSLTDGQICLLHWYAELIKQQEQELDLSTPNGIVRAVRSLVSSMEA